MSEVGNETAGDMERTNDRKATMALSSVLTSDRKAMASWFWLFLLEVLSRRSIGSIPVRLKHHNGREGGGVRSGKARSCSGENGGDWRDCGNGIDGGIAVEVVFVLEG